MSITVKSVLLLIGVILMVLSAIIQPQSRVDLFKLAWAFVVAGLVFS